MAYWPVRSFHETSVRANSHAPKINAIVLHMTNVAENSCLSLKFEFSLERIRNIFNDVLS